MPFGEGEPSRTPSYYGGFAAGVWDRFRGLLDPPEKAHEPFGDNPEFHQGYLDGWHYGNEHYADAKRPPRHFDPMA